MKIILNGDKMETRETTHKYLKEKLSLPEYYGGNLDALWDILSSWDKEIQIKLTNKNNLIENLGEYGQNIIQVFQDAEMENPQINFRII